MNRDDEMIDHALQRGALILTNDRFRKWKDGTEETKFEIDWDLVDEKLVQWWFEDDFFMPELLKKPLQSSNPTGTLPTSRAQKVVNNNSNNNPQKKKRGVFIKVLDLIFDNKQKTTKTQKKVKVQQKNQSKPKSPTHKKSQAKPQQKKAKPQAQKTASKETKPKKNPQNQKPKQTKPQQKKAKSQAQKTASKETKPSPQSKKSLLAKAPQKKPKPSSKKSNKSKQVKNTSSDIANFKSKILEILPDRKISIAGLATIINKQMVAAGIEKNPTTEFLKQYNLPKGLKKAIITHMSDEVIVTGTGPKFLIEKKSKADEKA